MKWLISGVLDSSRRLPLLVERHVHRCKSCREFLTDSKLIGECLERDAALLESSLCYVVKPVPTSYSFRLAVLTVSVLLISGYLAFYPVITPRDDGSVLSSVVNSKPDVSGLIGMGDTFARALTDKADAGLNGEIDNIVHDAKSAATFLSEALAFDVAMF